jgi:hypothetical protein
MEKIWARGERDKWQWEEYKESNAEKRPRKSITTHSHHPILGAATFCPFPTPTFGTNQQKLVSKRVKSRKLACGRDECNSNFFFKKGGRFRFDSGHGWTKGKGEKKIIKL